MRIIDPFNNVQTKKIRTGIGDNDKNQFGNDFSQISVGVGSKCMKTDSQGTWWGSNNYSGATAKVDMSGNATFSSVTVTGGTMSSGKTSFSDSTNAGWYISNAGIYLGSASDAKYLKYTIADGTFVLNGQSISNSIITSIGSGSELSIQGWQFNGTFSSTDYNTVSWTLGTLSFLDGQTFSIVAGNTGNMASLTYVYFDKAVSTTVLQTTTTAANAVGLNKVLVAVAQPVAETGRYALYQVFGGNGGIGGSFVTADTLNELAIQGWQFSSTFSSTDYNTVAWTSGVLTFLDGTSFSIDAGNTGNIAAKTYIYFDKTVSTTVLQTTTTAGNAVGSNKVLIAVAQNVSETGRYATYQVFGGTGGIGGSFVTSDTLNELAIQGWQCTSIFSATDYNTVAWLAGSLTFLDGTTFAIDAGNTGNIVAVTYIYFDKAVSNTVLQTTTTATNAVGSNKVLIAVTQPVVDITKKATYQVFGGTGGIGGTFITADNITAGTISTNEIAANTIVAGNIAAGTITTTQIAANTIVAGNIAAGTITTNEIAANTIVAGNIAAGTITTTQIAATTIVAGNIAAGTITTTQIAATTILAGNIAANTITANEIAANTITASQIAAGTITTTQIAANTIVAGDIAAGTITATEIAANTITASNLTVSASSANLIPEKYSSFEYFTFGNTVGTTTAGTTTAQAVEYQGVLCARHTASSNNSYLYLASSTTDYNITTRGSTTYIISAYIMSSSGTPTVRFHFKESDGTLRTAGIAFTITTAYRRYSKTFTTSVGITSILIAIENQVSGDVVYYDCVQLEESEDGATSPSAYASPSAVGEINADKINAGTITLSSTTVAMTVSDGGNILCNAGGDIYLTDDASNPSEIRFRNSANPTTKYWQIYKSPTNDTLYFNTVGQSGYTIFDLGNSTTGAGLFQVNSGFDSGTGDATSHIFYTNGATNTTWGITSSQRYLQCHGELWMSGDIVAVTGTLTIDSGLSGTVELLNASVLYIRSAGNDKSINAFHDDANGFLNTSSGGLKFGPNNNYVTPNGAGTINLGSATNYWNDFQYKTLTDAGCLGSFDEGVEMPNGKVYSDLEAISHIGLRNDGKKTIYGKPMLDYKTFPIVSYKKARGEDGKLLKRDNEDNPIGGVDGVEMTSMFSIFIGAFKQINEELKTLNKRLDIIETKS